MKLEGDRKLGPFRKGSVSQRVVVEGEGKGELEEYSG